MKKTSKPTPESETTQSQRELRYFSEEARKTIVLEIENGLGKSQAARKYKVGRSTIHKWVVAYSTLYQQSLKVVVEHESDSVRAKREAQENARLKQHIADDSVTIRFLESIIQQANLLYGVDLKKKLGTK